MTERDHAHTHGIQTCLSQRNLRVAKNVFQSSLRISTKSTARSKAHLHKHRRHFFLRVAHRHGPSSRSCKQGTTPTTPRRVAGVKRAERTAENPALATSCACCGKELQLTTSLAIASHCTTAPRKHSERSTGLTHSPPTLNHLLRNPFEQQTTPSPTR